MNTLKEELLKKSDSAVFIKVTDSPISSLTSEQKVQLNRKGNVLFNEGKIEEAKRIFIATGYSDGLTRVANNYYKNNKPLDALKLYTLAHNKNDSETIYEKMASVISVLLQEK